jgi:hypothetical protein
MQNYDDAYIKPTKQIVPITILLTKAKKETLKAQIKNVMPLNKH